MRVSMCYCLLCQRRTGSVFGVQARFLREQTRIEGEFKRYRRVGDTNTEVTLNFCPECGSTVFWHYDEEVLLVAVGAFAAPDFPPPTVTVYENRRHPWCLTAEGTILESWD